MRELYKFWHTSKDLQEEGSSIEDINIFRLKPTRMYDMLVTREITSLPLVIAHMWVTTLSLGALRNRRWYLALVLSPSIVSWLRQRERWCGSICSSKALASHLQCQCLCITIIRPPSLLLEILCLMSGQNILRLIVITSVIR